MPGPGLLMNHFSRQTIGGRTGERYRKSVWAQEKPICFLMPDFSDPFSGDRAADRVYQAMMNRMTAERRKERAGGVIRKLYGKRKKSVFCYSSAADWKTLGIISAGGRTGATHLAVWTANYLTGVRGEKNSSSGMEQSRRF